MKALSLAVALLVAPCLRGAEPATPAPALAIEPSLFMAQRQEHGYSWTLASRLGDILHLAETMFGPRDPAYTVLGVEFVADNPRIWYPGNRKYIVIQLQSSAASDMSRACYQLAHESVHLLAPTGGVADNFEEGLADYFASYYMRTQMNQPKWHSNLPSYQKASGLIAAHLDRTPDAIRRLRATQPTLSSITAEALATEFTELTPEEAEFLVQRFKR